jgi:hypothetical protein
MLAYDPLDSLTHDQHLALLRFLCDAALDSETMRGVLQREPPAARFPAPIWFGWLSASAGCLATAQNHRVAISALSTSHDGKRSSSRACFGVSESLQGGKTRLSM